eukprot:UN03240
MQSSSTTSQPITTAAITTTESQNQRKRGRVESPCHHSMPFSTMENSFDDDSAKHQIKRQRIEQPIMSSNNPTTTIMSSTIQTDDDFVLLSLDDNGNQNQNQNNMNFNSTNTNKKGIGNNNNNNNSSHDNDDDINPFDHLFEEDNIMQDQNNNDDLDIFATTNE